MSFDIYKNFFVFFILVIVDLFGDSTSIFVESLKKHLMWTFKLRGIMFCGEL